MHTSTYMPLLSCLALSVGGLQAAKLYTDPSEPNSLLLENFSTEHDSAAKLENGVSFDSNHEGIGHYKIAAEKDPILFFRGYVDPIDFQAYPNVRMRHSFSAASQQVAQGSLFPLPVKPEGFVKHDINSALVARQATFENGPNAGLGLRLDPVDGLSVAGDYRIDYIIVDRGRTLGFEFDQKNSSRGGVNNFFVGFNLGGTNGKEIISNIDHGAFTGQPTKYDPMMLLKLKEGTGIGAIDTSIYKFVEIRMRLMESGGEEATIYFENESGGFAENQIVLPLVDDIYFHTYLIDLREDPAWNAGPVHNLRFDPVKGMQAFQIDHIRFYETVNID